MRGIYYDDEIYKLSTTLVGLSETVDPPTEEHEITENNKHQYKINLIDTTLSRAKGMVSWHEWEYFTCLTLGKYTPSEIQSWPYKEVIKTSLLLKINQYLS